MKKLYTLFFVFLATINFANAQDGSLDLSFGFGGKLLMNPALVNDCSVLSDGKIIVVGSIPDTGVSKCYVSRLNSNGSLDSSFGSAGKTLTYIGYPTASIGSVLIQPDGKILASGYIIIPPTPTYKYFLIRYNSDGSLDSSFDSDGILIVTYPDLEGEFPSISLQADGRIVLGGTTWLGLNKDFVIFRFLADGNFDSSFDGDGIVLTDLGAIESLKSVVIQTDGKIVAAGSTYDGISSKFLACRYILSGDLDASFDVDGVVTTNIGTIGGSSSAMDVLIQPDEKLILAGRYSNGAYSDFAVARYKIDGSMDSSFGAYGKVATDIDGFYDFAYAMVLQSDGKIILAGVGDSGGPENENYALVRYLSDGSPDSLFGTGGEVTTDFWSGSDACYKITLQPDGKIIAIGTMDNGTIYRYMARYNSSLIGIQEKGFQNAIKLYPNPTSSKINLQVEKSLKDASITIVDVSGQIILNQHNISGNNFSFDVSKYSSGIYFLEVRSHEGVERVKFVKE